LIHHGHAQLDAWLGLGAAVSGYFGALALRRRSPRWHWILIRYPTCFVRILSTWRALCLECGLTAARRTGRALLGDLVVKGDELKPRVPRLLIGLPTFHGLTARIRLLPGQTPDAYAQAVDAMAHTWRVHAVRATSPTRGTVHLTVIARDPLSQVIVRADPNQDPTARAGRGRVLRLVRSPSMARLGAGLSLALVVGVREDGRAWVIDLRKVPHWLITGATRSGKSTLIHALVVRLAPLPVALVGIDLKGGMELSLYAPRLTALATTRGEAAGLLAELVDLVLDRMQGCRAAGVRSVWDLPAVPPPVVVLVDEVAELYLVGDKSEKETRERAAVALLRLAQLGAALGVHLIVGGQRVGSDLGPGLTALRAQLGGRVCHHVSDPETAVMTLGDVFPDAVDAAQLITPDQQGCAVTTDGEAGWLRARSTYTTPNEAADTARRYAHQTPVLPGIGRPTDAEGGEN
jgi:S-DNA-T family DNA segregation ATPase FtsK/SpoIIIE